MTHSHSGGISPSIRLACFLAASSATSDDGLKQGRGPCHDLESTTKQDITSHVVAAFVTPKPQISRTQLGSNLAVMAGSSVPARPCLRPQQPAIPPLAPIRMLRGKQAKSDDVSISPTQQIFGRGVSDDSHAKGMAATGPRQRTIEIC